MSRPPIHGLQVHRAQRFIERLCGLLARPRLQLHQALLLSPCASVHTCFMRYPIDVVFLDAQAQVLQITPALKPWRMALCLRAHSTLELCAGAAQHFGLRVGCVIPAATLRGPSQDSLNPRISP